MFTDIEGYTAAMQHNEDAALLMRSKHREVFDRETEKYQGEIIQYYGDGTLSVFDSAVNAVECAIAIQDEMKKPPRVPLRAGIHSGDIIYSDDAIIGDGVNVASRIESLSVPGSVFISEKVFDEVKNSSTIRTQFLKSFRLKNVDRPVRVYAVSNPGLVVPDPKIISGKLAQDKKLTLAKRLAFPGLLMLALVAILGYWFGSRTGTAVKGKKVAVVPFELMSTDPEDKDLVTGMTGGLITELSKVEALSVIDQGSSRLLLGSVGPANALWSNEIHKIHYFVKGAVSRNANGLELTISLSESLQGKPIWNERYASDMTGVRLLWGQVAGDLARRMGIKLKPEAAAHWSELRAVKPETYELYLKGVHYMNMSTPQDWERGLVYFQEALDENPADPYAYAGLAEAYVRLGHGPAPPPDVFPKALAAAKRAIKLDSTLADGWAALADYHTYFGRDWELAEDAFRRADALNPNLAYNHYHRAWYLAMFGRMNEAIEEHVRAQELDPFTPLHTAWLGELYRWVGRYEDALAETDKAELMQDNYALGKLIRGFTLESQGKIEEALSSLKEAAAINPGWRYFGYGPALIRAGRLPEGQAILAELESKPVNPWRAFCLGFLYDALGNSDKALQWFSYKPTHAWLPVIRVMYVSDRLRQDPRFLKLVRELGLPDPAPLQYDPEA